MSEPEVKPMDTTEAAAAELQRNTSDDVVKKPKDPRFVIERVGHIPWAAGGQHYSGCKLMVFESKSADGKHVSAEEAANAFFEQHQNLMVVEWRYDVGYLCLVVTNVLNEHQLHVLKTRGDIIEKMVEEEIQRELDAENAENDGILKEQDRLKELAKQGEHCLKNHGAVLKTMREKSKKK